MLSALLTMLLSAGQPQPAVAMRKYDITSENKHKPVQILVAPNRLTSVRFNRTFDPKGLYCGDNNRFVVHAIDETQINIKAVSADLGLETNCTMLTKTGIPVVLNLVIAEGKKADLFVDVVFSISDLPTTEAELVKRLEGVELQMRAAADTARKECNDKAALSLAQDAASGIVSRRVDARTQSANVLLTVNEFLKLGSRGFIRFLIDNQSREPFAAATVRITISEPGKEGFEPESAAVYFAQPILERNEQTYGAVSFSLHEVSDSARVTIKVFERNGVRHPEIKDMRL